MQCASKALASLLLACLTSGLPGAFLRADNKQPSRWESAIVAFDKQDQDKPPPKHGIVFVGSSSIRFWNLSTSFPHLGAINRGFGGSELADSVHFAQRLVLKHEPRLIVLYAGDNDIGGGKSPEQVASDFRDFVKVVHQGLPETKIIYLSIKPSILRWKLWPKMQQANALIETLCNKETGLTFVDVASPMLGPDGKPKRELFRGDGLHLNDKGYALWASVLEPSLK
jgi:lysophospholipase L1-like esterase